MGPHSPQAPALDMLRQRLDEQINMKHPLVRLAGLINRDEIHRSFAGHFSSGRGRPALSPRLVAGHAVPAACLRRIRRGGGGHLSGEPLLAVLHRRGLPADRTANRSVEPDALEKAHRRGRCRDASGADHRGGAQGRDIGKTSVDRAIVDTTVMPKGACQEFCVRGIA